MSNRIRSLSLHTRSLCPTEAEVWVLPEVEQVTPTSELRGRLIGPTCAYANTIEVAYPLQPFPKPLEGLSPLVRRVVIPEPSFWAPMHPFLYCGVIELWQDGACVERRSMRHALRTAHLSPDGLTWNGKPLKLRAVDRPNLVETDLAALHRDGINALILAPEAEPLWRAAGRLGFLVIGRISEPMNASFASAESPACLGWLLRVKSLQDRSTEEWIKVQSRVHRRFVGIELEDVPEQSLPPEISFVVARAESPHVADRPRLLRGADGELGRITP